MKKRDFVKFYDDNATNLYRFAYLKLSSKQDSEDLVSDTFFRLWDKVGKKKLKIDNPRAFLFKIANNLIVDAYRKKAKKEISLDIADAKMVNIRDNTDLSEHALFDDATNEIRQAIGRLRPEYQDIIIWHYLDDFSVKEIAQISEKSENNVRVLLHRATKSLKTALNSQKTLP